MNTFKGIGLAGIAVTALFAAQAFATTCPVNAQGTQTQGGPVCIAPYGLDGNGTGLHDVLGAGSDPHSIFTANSPGIDPYTAQAQKAYWTVNGSGGSVATILLQIAAYANQDTFGIFDPTNPANKLAILTNGQNGYQATLSIFSNGGYSVGNANAPQVTFGTTNEFGFYLTTPDGDTFYSLPSLNADDGTAHMVAYQGGTGNSLKPYGSGTAQRPGGEFGSTEYILAWEDLPLGSSDLDYNDFIVMVESIHPVPEPATLGMFGLGLLLIGGFVALRRRQSLNA